MADDITVEEERALRALFAGAIPSVADDGFSGALTRRLRIGIWRRRLLLALAGVAGFVIASPAIAEILVVTSQLLATLVTQSDDGAGAGQLRLLLTMLPVRELVEGASEKLMNVSGTIAWFRQYEMLLVAAIPALGSLAIARLLER
ncbi:hypothetical protein BH24PSE2_BH24PSE2_02720 [soil metagenome]